MFDPEADRLKHRPPRGRRCQFRPAEHQVDLGKVSQPLFSSIHGRAALHPIAEQTTPFVSAHCQIGQIHRGSESQPRLVAEMIASLAVVS